MVVFHTLIFQERNVSEKICSELLMIKYKLCVQDLNFCEFGSILYCTHIIDGFHGNWDVIVPDTKHQLFSLLSAMFVHLCFHF